MKLSPEQENEVARFVDAQDIQLTDLRDNLIDHLCCVIESQLSKSKNFDQLLEEAAHDIAPEGLKYVENQTIFLLNSKRILLMKKALYTIGFIGSITLAAGTTFKLMNWPYGYHLFAIGFLTLLLLFVPLWGLDRYKVVLSKALSEKMKVVLGVTAAIITGLSGLFKVLHLQGASWLLVLGALVFMFGFLPFFFFTMYKKSIS